MKTDRNLILTLITEKVHYDKLENPFIPTKNEEQTDPVHYKITNRNEVTHYYKKQFKKQKKNNQLSISHAPVTR